MNGPSKGHILPYLRKGIYHKICFCARAAHRSVPAGPLSAFPRGQHPRPHKPAQKIAHTYFVCFSPPRSLLKIGPELHRLQNLSKRDDAPRLLLPHLGPRLVSVRLRSLAPGARDVCSEDSFVSHKFLECVYFAGIGRVLWYVAPSFKLTALRVR